MDSIKLRKQILNTNLWCDGPFSRGQAWIDLLLLTDAKGNLITSQSKLMARWGWGNTKTRNFLGLLQDQGLIERTAKKEHTLITIINFGQYQGDNLITTYEQPALNEVIATDNKEQQSDNNLLATQQKKENDPIFGEDSAEYKLADYLRRWILKNNPKARVPQKDNLDSWAKHIDYMIRIDGRTPDEIKSIIEFSQKDSFWLANILSTAKLRKQFDQLYMKQQTDKQNPAASADKKFKTKFHLARSRGDKYTAEELEKAVLERSQSKLKQRQREKSE